MVYVRPLRLLLLVAKDLTGMIARFNFETDAENWRLRCLIADYAVSFESAKERIAHRIRMDEERAIAANEKRLYDWTVNEYWPEIERIVEMAGAKGRGRPAKASQAQQLLEALDFVSFGTGEIEDWHKYVRLSGNMAVTFNGQIGAGHPIAEEVTVCPQLDRLTAALKRCGKTLVISETGNFQLSIKGDKLRALVPCVANAEDLPLIVPDAPIAVISDVLKQAFKVCASISSEAAESVVEASLLLEANCCTSISKGKTLLLQFWHGIDLPPLMVIPKIFAEAVVKQAKPLTGFGFSWQGNKVGSVTFWFEGGSWIKTQCYSDAWPDINPLVNVASYPVETPAGLFEACEAVMHFNDNGDVIFAENGVMSHDTDNAGAQYEVKGLQGGKRFAGKLLKAVAPHAKTIDLTTLPDRAFFFGGEPSNPVRGIVMGIGVQTRHNEPVTPEAPGTHDQTAQDYTPCPECNDEGDGCEACT